MTGHSLVQEVMMAWTGEVVVGLESRGMMSI